MSQVISKKLSLLNVPNATEQETVQQLVITPEGRVRQKTAPSVETPAAPSNDTLLYVFMVGKLGIDGHYHTLGITASEFQFLLASSTNRLTKSTSTAADHTHEIVFGFDPMQNSFEVDLMSVVRNTSTHQSKLIAINAPNFWGFSGFVQISQNTALNFVNGIATDYMVD